MKKKFLKFMLLLSVIVGLFAAMTITVSAASSGTCGDNLTWTLDNAGTLTISGTGDMYDYTSSTAVPWDDSRDSIKSVIIEDGVTSIGSDAFSNCDSLATVTIGDSVTTIGSCAFDYCYLTNITIPDSVTTIGDAAFRGCLLTNVIIPNSVTTIGDDAFCYCNLTSIIIPSSVTTIGVNAFFICPYLTTIKVDTNNANYSSDDNGVLFNKNKTRLIQYPMGKQSISYDIPDSVTTIEEYAFNSCINLSTVTIGDSVTTIGDEAFDNCNSLQNVYYKGTKAQFDSITIVEDGNESLTNATLYLSCGENVYWTLDEASGTLTITGTGAMYDYSSSSRAPWNEYRNDISKVVIEDGVTNIGQFAFSFCQNLTDVNILGGITSINPGAFQGCESLVNIIIPNSVTSIGKYAFYDCESLTGIIIPQGVKLIDTHTFYGCSNLISITIPDSITDIYSHAFDYCESLKNVYISDLTAWCNIDILFEDNSPMYYAENLYLDNVLLTELIIPDEVTKICAGAFYNCINITSITIPDSVTSIGRYAFHNTGYYNDSSNWENDILYIGNYLIDVTESISGTHIIKDGTKCIAEMAFYNYDAENTLNIEMPDSVTNIGRGAFYCSGLESIELSNCITRISEEMFYGCNITNISIPDGVTSIGDSAFFSCRLTSITIPNSITTIEDYAFSYCNNLKTVYYTGTEALFNGITIGDYNDYLTNADIYFPCGEQTFWSLNDSGTLTITGAGEMYDYTQYTIPWYDSKVSIKSVIIEDGVTNIGDYAFYNCVNLTAITIPDSVTEIGGYTFYRCTNLVEVTIPDGVTYIGGYAFYSCENLTAITIPNSVTGIGEETFAYCNSLTSVEIPWRVGSMGDYAFGWCENLTAVVIPNSIPTIGYMAFFGCSNFKTVYYMGTEKDWESHLIYIHDYLNYATIIFMDSNTMHIAISGYNVGITSGSLTGDISLDVFNVADDETVKAIVAVYGADGKFIGVSSGDIAVSSGDSSVKLDLAVPVAENQNGGYVKVFFWNNLTDLTPYSRCDGFEF